jgi:hypothetical protein
VTWQTNRAKDRRPDPQANRTYRVTRVGWGHGPSRVAVTERADSAPPRMHHYPSLHSCCCRRRHCWAQVCSSWKWRKSCWAPMSPRPPRPSPRNRGKIATRGEPWSTVVAMRPCEPRVHSEAEWEWGCDRGPRPVQWLPKAPGRSLSAPATMLKSALGFLVASVAVWTACCLRHWSWRWPKLDVGMTSLTGFRWSSHHPECPHQNRRGHQVRRHRELSGAQVPKSA